MKTKFFLSILALGLYLSALSQNTIELTFTAIDNTEYEKLDSVKVMNRTRGGDTVLFYPDTVLVLDYQLGISETNTGIERLQLLQNYPNPVTDQTTISFYVPERDKVSLIVTNMLGRVLIKTERILDHGYHSYRFSPGNGSLFIFTLQWRENNSSIKILKTNSVSNNSNTLEYMGSEDSFPLLKATVDIRSYLFNLGDELLYIGYKNTLQSGILVTPDSSETYIFQFAYNIPCPGTPTVEYEGQTYNTVQIMSQCWLKGNLNVGTMILGNQEMTDNDTVEKFCYNNEPDSCSKYGGLYQWDEMMQYTTQHDVQGICPPGWHIPSDDEWKVLEGAVDSLFGIGDSEWDWILFRGFDAGKRLKNTTGWNSDGNGIDEVGFSALPVGCSNSNGDFYPIGYFGWWWSSTRVSSHYSRRMYRCLSNDQDKISSNYEEIWEFGFSVRCVRD